MYVYYHCPYNPSNPRHVAAHPDHPARSVSIREEAIMTAIAAFLDQYVFGHDRAAMLAAQIPATSAEHAAPRQRPARPARSRAGPHRHRQFRPMIMERGGVPGAGARSRD